MYQPTSPCAFALPAEWEPQSAIMLTWPHAGTDWKPYLRQITNTYLELSDIITRYEHLLVVTPIVESTRSMLAERLSPEQMSRVHLYEMDTNDTWARDHGPISLVSRSKRNSYIIPIHLLDFKFNGWGEKFAWQKDNAINLQLYYQGAFDAAMENHQGFVLEGGSIESASWHPTATSLSHGRTSTSSSETSSTCNRWFGSTTATWWATTPTGTSTPS